MAKTTGWLIPSYRLRSHAFAGKECITRVSANSVNDLVSVPVFLNLLPVIIQLLEKNSIYFCFTDPAINPPG
jgi:hypothetical protein